MVMDRYQFMPPLSEAEYEELKTDIAERGVQVPVEYDEDGNILDGHHRVQICKELGIEDWPSVIRGGMTEEEKVEHALTLNLSRRHLTREQRRELVVKLRRQGWSLRRIAARLGVSHEAVRQDAAGVNKLTPDNSDTSRVTGADGKQYPATRPKPVPSVFSATSQRREQASELLKHTEAISANVGEEAGRQILSGVAPFSERDIKRIASLEPDKQKAIVSKVLSGEAKGFVDARRLLRKEAVQEAPPLEGKYRIIYADPPWKYGDERAGGRWTGATDHYPTMSIDELCELPVRDLAEDNAVLFLWVTSPLLEDAFKVINAWGFKYKGSFVWDKVKHNMGHYNSVRHEFLLICTRGSCTPDNVKLFDSVQSIERTEHSRKPEEFREIIDTLYTHGKRIELFARRPAEGWEVWGNDPSVAS